MFGKRPKFAHETKKIAQRTAGSVLRYMIEGKAMSLQSTTK
jgi:hypothetical protein